jgi:tetratricopeptide (TPR) repeat protein
MTRALESQRAGFEAYQRCIAAHRSLVDLHYAAGGVIQFRDRRAQLEAIFATDPRAKQQYPGGVEQMGAAAFARYRSLGGTARSIAEVEPVPTPCPPPALPPSRVEAGRAPTVTDRKTVHPQPPPALASEGAHAAVDLQTQDPSMQMEIARRYRYSLGGVPEVADSFAEAMKWYRKAAEQGHAPAMKALGDLYATGGAGVRRDIDDAQRWYRRAADKGDADAIVALGRTHAQDGPGWGRRDDQEAVRWYRKAAERGHPLAMYQLAEALQNGRGVTQDRATALEWYRRAAQGGNAVAASWVALAERCRKAGKPPESCL